MSATPTHVDHDKKQLMIRWDNGQICAYELLALRKHCLSTRYEAANSERARQALDALTSIHLLRWNYVGRYGIEMHWSDGHQSIYTFDRLWSICEKASLSAPAEIQKTPQ
jgi:DUF971 family protein